MIRNILKWIKQGWKMVGEPFWIDLEGLFILGASILVHFGPFCFYFGKNWNWKNRLFKIDSNQSPLYKMLKMTIGSFHGFGKKSILTWFSRVKSGFFGISWFFDFTCKSLNSSYIDPRQEILQNLYKFNCWAILLL